MYDLQINEGEFYIFDQVHTVLTQVYSDQEYPITDILNLVRCLERLKKIKVCGL